MKSVRTHRSIPALAITSALALLSGCSAFVGRATTPLTAKRELPGVVLCMSERVGGGIRIIGKVDPGNYPITGATLQYKIAGPSDAVPATTVGTELELTGARSESVQYRKGSNEVVFSIDADQARNLRGKVLWYRWVIEYARGGSSIDRTGIHRTSLEEAGLPRDAFTPGPDSSVAPASARRR